MNYIVNEPIPARAGPNKEIPPGEYELSRSDDPEAEIFFIEHDGPCYVVMKKVWMAAQKTEAVELKL